MAERRSFGDVLRSVARAAAFRNARSRADDGAPLIDLCAALTGEQAEGSGLAAAQRILDRLDRLSCEEKVALLTEITRTFGADDDTLAAAMEAWTPGDAAAARRIHYASEPRSQTLIRALNSVPGATARLVALRAELLEAAREAPELKELDQDFRHLFASWFNRGFLEIRRIDWTTSAQVLEKIIAYEAVHEITGWDDLRRRVGDPDRRLFAFFHPAMPIEPLIFVEVALTGGIPSAIGPILDDARVRLQPHEATTAVFYSISNCQKGLRGVSFGNFLIKQVVAELAAELPGLDTFVTLSPVPGLRRWAESATAAQDGVLDEHDRLAIAAADAIPGDDAAARITARYLLNARRDAGVAADPVAHFHLGNGAALHRIHPSADPSPRGLANSWGVMVNYLYEGERIEERHEAYASQRAIAASRGVRALAEG